MNELQQINERLDALAAQVNALAAAGPGHQPDHSPRLNQLEDQLKDLKSAVDAVPQAVAVAVESASGGILKAAKAHTASTIQAAAETLANHQAKTKRDLSGEIHGHLGQLAADGEKTKAMAASNANSAADLLTSAAYAFRNRGE